MVLKIKRELSEKLKRSRHCKEDESIKTTEYIYLGRDTSRMNLSQETCHYNFCEDGEEITLLPN